MGVVVAMNEQFNEQLSALVDGEASDLETRSLLKRLDSMSTDERNQAYQRWSRYQEMSEVLSEEHGNHIAADNFLARVSEALDQESKPSVSADFNEQIAVNSQNEAVTKKPSAWSGLAVAASVALAVIVGFQQYELNSLRGQTPDSLLTASNANIQQESEQAVNATTDSVFENAALEQSVAASNEPFKASLQADSPVEAAEAQRRLTEYLLEHASQSTQPGMSAVPFARVAGFETVSE